MTEGKHSDIKSYKELFVHDAELLSVSKAGTERATVKPLLKFKNGIWSLPKSYLLKSYLQLLKNTLAISGSIVGPVVVNSIGIICLNLKGLGFEQACLGICTSIYLLFGSSLSLSLFDKIGMNLSVSYGKKNFSQMKNSFQKGLLTLAITTMLITFPIMVFSAQFLSAINIAPENIELCQKTLRLLFVLFLMALTGDSLRTYCTAQSLETHFSIISFPNTFLCCFLTYIFVVVFDMKILGYLLARLIFELINISAGLVVYFKFTKKDSRGFASWRETFQDFGSYFKDSIFFIAGGYCEYIGYEATTFFVAQLHDNDQMAAYTATYNICGLIYTLGVSIAIICRTRINILVGLGLKTTARNVYMFYCISAFVTGLGFSILFPTYRNILAWLYSDSNPKIRSCFLSLELIYFVFYAPFECALYSVMIGIKTLGKIKTLLKANIGILLVANVLSSWGVFSVGGQAPHLWATLLGWLVILNLILLYLSLNSDWKEIKEEDFELPPPGPEDELGEEVNEGTDRQDGKDGVSNNSQEEREPKEMHSLKDNKNNHLEGQLLSEEH